MQYYKESIFPTDVFIFDNILEVEYIDSMRNDVILSSKQNSRENWQSEPNIHTFPKYKALSNKIVECSKVVFNDKKYEYDTFEITDMWSNILRSGEFHRPHTHSNNILSGVYYVESDEAANIRFYDPRPQANVLSPKVKEFDKTNSSLWYFPSKTNRLILFPSWLQHYVPINHSDKLRISIAFNIMFRGLVGDPKELQSANY
tara:strand:- start:233 stop:838 length:606 start_codon:yes stop_codon:yes gene_type:complete